ETASVPQAASRNLLFVVVGLLAVAARDLTVVALERIVIARRVPRPSPAVPHIILLALLGRHLLPREWQTCPAHFSLSFLYGPLRHFVGNGFLSPCIKPLRSVARHCAMPSSRTRPQSSAALSRAAATTSPSIMPDATILLRLYALYRSSVLRRVPGGKPASSAHALLNALSA